MKTRYALLLCSVGLVSCEAFRVFGDATAKVAENPVVQEKAVGVIQNAANGNVVGALINLAELAIAGYGAYRVAYAKINKTRDEARQKRGEQVGTS